MRCLFVLLIFSFACNLSLEVPTSSVPSTCDGPGLTATTYNVGLAPGVVPLATPRIAAVAEEVAKLRDTGLVCLQEVWTEAARDAIVAALGLPEDRMYWVETQGMGEEPPGSNVCRRGEIAPVADCVRERCASLADPEETTLCARQACHRQLLALHLKGGGDCLDCLAASVGLGLEEIEARCTRPAPGATRAYGGRNGVMLISRWPLVKRAWEMLPASYSNRVALYATVAVPDREPIEVACTHVSTWNELPPALKDDAGILMFPDWTQEMNRQVRSISATLAKRADGRPQLFLGDMNAGPSIGRAIRGTMPSVWRTIVSLGFSSPAARAAVPFCSTCEGNSFRSPDAGNYLIDHVLVRDPVGGSRLTPACARPVLDGRHLRMFRGYGSLVEAHLSDHYGVSVTFRHH